MSISDTQFRLGVGVVGAVLVAGIAAVRFFGDVKLPPKPPPPTAITRGTSSALLTRSSSSPAIYLDLVARDAAAAGIATPGPEELSRKLVDHEDSERHVLEVNQQTEAAGLRLRVVRMAEGLALEITNLTGQAVAYHVVTTPIPAAACEQAPMLPFNAMTIAKGRRETRVECRWRNGIALAITRVETVELPALAAVYLDRVPPAMVGIEPRIARAHTTPTVNRCVAALPQAVRSGLERGEIRWRDLIDFFARHRCETYHFPMGYRAFTDKDPRTVPVVSSGM